MIDRNTILRHLYSSGRINTEAGVIKKVDEALLEASKSPMDAVPKKLSLDTKRPDENAKMSIENLLRAFYTEPDDICYFEYDDVKETIDPKIYAAMRAILNLGVTPDSELAVACSNIFKQLLSTRQEYMDSATRLSKLPHKSSCEKEICAALGKLWGVS